MPRDKNSLVAHATNNSGNKSKKKIKRNGVIDNSSSLKSCNGRTRGTSRVLDENTTKNKGLGKDFQKSRKSFSSKSVVSTHQRKISGESFSSTNSYDGSEHQPKGYKCDLCQRVFSYKHVMRRHRSSMHTNEMNFNCDICHEKFPRNDYLERHRRTKHSIAKELFVCKVCDKVFGYKQVLEIHERKHSGEKPYSCRHCGKKFARKDNMIKHQQNHEISSINTKLICDYCGETFYNKNDLVNHLQSHSKMVEKVSKNNTESSNLFPITEVFIDGDSRNAECYNHTLLEKNTRRTIVQFIEI